MKPFEKLNSKQEEARSGMQIGTGIYIGGPRVDWRLFRSGPKFLHVGAFGRYFLVRQEGAKLPESYRKALRDLQTHQ